MLSLLNSEAIILSIEWNSKKNDASGIEHISLMSNPFQIQLNLRPYKKKEKRKKENRKKDGGQQ